MTPRDLIAGVAGQVLGHVRVSVKTNLGPEFEVGEGSGLARALGIQAAVIVRDRQSGRELARYGEVPATNAALVAVLLAALALAGFALVRGLVKR